MKRILVLAFCFLGLSGPSAAQTSDGFFGDAMSSSTASVRADDAPHDPSKSR